MQALSGDIQETPAAYNAVYGKNTKLFPSRRAALNSPQAHKLRKEYGRHPEVHETHYRGKEEFFLKRGGATADKPKTTTIQTAKGPVERKSAPKFHSAGHEGMAGWIARGCPGGDQSPEYPMPIALAGMSFFGRMTLLDWQLVHAILAFKAVAMAEYPFGAVTIRLSDLASFCRLGRKTDRILKALDGLAGREVMLDLRGIDKRHKEPRRTVLIDHVVRVGRGVVRVKLSDLVLNEMAPREKVLWAYVPLSVVREASSVYAQGLIASVVWLRFVNSRWVTKPLTLSLQTAADLMGVNIDPGQKVFPVRVHERFRIALGALRDSGMIAHDDGLEMTKNRVHVEIEPAAQAAKYRSFRGLRSAFDPKPNKHMPGMYVSAVDLMMFARERLGLASNETNGQAVVRAFRMYMMKHRQETCSCALAGFKKWCEDLANKGYSLPTERIGRDGQAKFTDQDHRDALRYWFDINRRPGVIGRNVVEEVDQMEALEAFLKRKLNADVEEMGATGLAEVAAQRGTWVPNAELKELQEKAAAPKAEAQPVEQKTDAKPAKKEIPSPEELRRMYSKVAI